VGEKMGIETAIILGLSVASAAGEIRQSEKQAAAVARQGELEAKNKAKDVRLNVARQTASFLNSGLELEGTPMASIQGMYKTGLKDVNQIRENTNIQTRNIISQGQSAAMSTLAQAGMGYAGGVGLEKIGSAVTENVAYGMNNLGFGNEAYDLLQASDIRNGFYSGK
jgi:hypothetical protein